MRKSTRLVLFAATLWLPLHSHAASFNCTKAKTETEKTICSTKQLSNLDELLAVSFNKALASTHDKTGLKAEQRDWLTDERDACHDVACLKKAYTDRIATLNEAIADAEATDTAPTGWHEVTADPSLVVRDKPSVTGNKIGTVPFGGKINVLEATGKTDHIGGRNGSWVKVQWQSKPGYAFDAFLDKLPTEKTDTSDAPPPKTEKPVTKPVKTSGGKRLQGVISSYDCGDNCYLTITDAKGEDHVGLCSAPTCDAWNEVAEMPASFKNKAVEVVIGKGTQYDGGGNVMGEMDAFEEVIFTE